MLPPVSAPHRITRAWHDAWHLAENESSTGRFSPCLQTVITSLSLLEVVAGILWITNDPQAGRTEKLPLRDGRRGHVALSQPVLQEELHTCTQ